MNDQAHEAFAIGIVMGLMLKHNFQKEDYLGVLKLPEAKAIARQEPDRVLAQLYRYFGVSFDD